MQPQAPAPVMATAHPATVPPIPVAPTSHAIPDQTTAVSDAPNMQGLPIRPGECWVQAAIQPRPQRKPLEIVVRDAVNDIKVTPERLERTTETVEVREGGITYRIEPAVYKPVTEKVLVRPEIRRSVVVPAVFEERTVEVEVEAAHTVLERCKLATARSHADSPVQPMCAREVPARIEKVKRKVLITPETTREEVIPAVYKTITRWVLEKPAQAIPVEVPARTAKLKVQTVAEPERIEEENLPPKVREFLATQYEGEPRLVIRQAVCDDDLTPTLAASLQSKLKEAGFDPGAADGKWGKRTFQALLAYQRQNGLAVGALTYETLQSLGLSTPK
ncbi:MAG: peptidoglycan-binding domain-containing protein [Halothiobacillaceae bacterium]